MTRPLDDTDIRLLATLRSTPQATVSEIAAAVGIARGTVYSRVDRLHDEGVIIGHGPDVDATRAGLGVLAFATLEIAQGSHDATIAALAALPEITEIHTVTGQGDLLCRILTRSNDHLHDVLQRIAAVDSVRRSQTQLALSTPHRRSDADAVIALGTGR